MEFQSRADEPARWRMQRPDPDENATNGETSRTMVQSDRRQRDTQETDDDTSSTVQDKQRFSEELSRWNVDAATANTALSEMLNHRPIPKLSVANDLLPNLDPVLKTAKNLITHLSESLPTDDFQAVNAGFEDLTSAATALKQYLSRNLLLTRGDTVRIESDMVPRWSRSDKNLGMITLVWCGQASYLAPSREGLIWLRCDPSVRRAQVGMKIHDDPEIYSFGQVMIDPDTDFKPLVSKMQKTIRDLDSVVQSL